MYIDKKLKEYNKRMESFILGTYFENAFPNHIKSENAETTGQLFLALSEKESFKDFSQNIRYESGTKQAQLTYSIGNLSNMIETANFKMESVARALRYNNVTDQPTIDRLFSERFNDIADIVGIEARSEADMEVDSLTKHISVLLEDAVKERTKAREEEEEKKEKEKQELTEADKDLDDLEDMIDNDDTSKDPDDDDGDGETDYDKLANDKYGEEEVKEEEEIDKDLDSIPTGMVDEEEETKSEGLSIPFLNKKEQLKDEEKELAKEIAKKDKLEEKARKKLIKKIYNYNHEYDSYAIYADEALGESIVILIRQLLNGTVFKKGRKKSYKEYYDAVDAIYKDKEKTLNNFKKHPDSKDSKATKKLETELSNLKKEMSAFENKYLKEFGVQVYDDIAEDIKEGKESFYISNSDYIQLYTYAESTKEDQDEVIADLKLYQKDLTGDKAKDALSKIGSAAKDVAKMPINIAVSIAKTTYDMLVSAKVKRDAKRGPAATHNKNISFALICYKADILTADKWIDMTDKLIASGKGSDSQKKQLKEIKNYYEYFKKDSENKVKDIEKTIEDNRKATISKESVNLLLKSQDELVSAYSESFNGEKNLLNSSEEFKESLHSQSLMIASFIAFKEHFKLV